MWDILATIFGLAGITLAVLFYIKSRSVRRLSYDHRSFTLLGESTAGLPNFEATYEGRPLEALRVTKVLIWNSGSTTLNQSDIASGDALSVSLPGDARILENRVLATASKTNRVSLCRAEQGAVQPQFEYLDPRQGFVLSVLHTGGGSQKVAVCGTIKGGTLAPYEGGRWLRYVIPFAFVGLSIIVFTAAKALEHFAGLDMPWMFWAAAAFLLLSMVVSTFREELARRGCHPNLNTVFNERFSPAELHAEWQKGPAKP